MEDARWNSAHRIAAVQCDRRRAKFVLQASNSTRQPGSRAVASLAVKLGWESVLAVPTELSGIRDRDREPSAATMSAAGLVLPEQPHEPARTHEDCGQSGSRRNWHEPPKRSRSARRPKSRASAGSGSRGEKSCHRSHGVLSEKPTSFKKSRVGNFSMFCFRARPIDEQFNSPPTREQPQVCPTNRRQTHFLLAGRSPAVPHPARSGRPG